ncbi:hypothetical protein C8R41DRAFT_820335 [Lentinula lateritia]|uniref:J domain-containing protein n=1 Tax=Lentinula lateritia TaxID=40482 RepID=A0ABQ8VR65_9AGAR|nr:hypothetical protein C8R41DRAFT_820335 [Lentinula lateritia]
MSRASVLVNAYSVLGLEEGVSLEVVKNTYKQAALRTHPDKNPDNPDATAEFQRVGEAYNILLKHLDTSRATGRPHSSSADSSEDEYYGYDDGLNFYVFVFENFMRDRSQSYSQGHQRGPSSMPSFGYPRFHPLPPEPEPEPAPRETAQERTERLRRAREVQEAAELRRKREAAVRKELKEQDRKQERLAAEQRRKTKNREKKAKAHAQRQQAEDAARSQREKVQKNRSAVFQAAREVRVEDVKKGIWENDVDAAGGEVKSGHEDFVYTVPKDPKETLLHIAVRNGNLDLVDFLDKHGAEMEERDSQNSTAFHVAIQQGHLKIIDHLFKHYPPQDPDHNQIYVPPPSKSVLSLALQSHEPEVVFMVLQPENRLSNSQDVNDAWSWINSPEGRTAMTRYSKGISGDIVDKFNDICTLLGQFGGFTPPATPILNRKNKASSPVSKVAPQAHQHYNSRKGRGRGRARVA